MFRRVVYAAVAVLLLAAASAGAAPAVPSSPPSAARSRLAAGAEEIIPVNRGPGEAQYVEGELLVSIKPQFMVEGTMSRDASLGFAALNAATGAQVAESLTMSSGVEVFRLTLPAGVVVEDAAATYGASRFVQHAEPNYLWFPEEVPNDPWFDWQWGYHNTGSLFHPSGAFNELGLPGADIDAVRAWDVRTDASDVLVAVIDSGIMVTHPDLKANIWVNPGEIAGNGIDDDGNGFIDDINGWDFANDDASVYDDPDADMHGTHVAGTIGAVGNNSASGTGVAWTARIMSAKFIHGRSGSTMNALKAVDYVAQMGAKVCNCSWGGGGYSGLLEQAMANSGILFVTSAGNEGLDNDLYPHYPSSYDLPNVISVAASDWNDNLVNFSCFGAESVDIAAPGYWVLSITPTGGAWMAGTSMATPHVTGAAALVAAEHPAIPLYGDGLTIKDIILRSADRNPAFTGKMTTGGRLNLANAINLQFPVEVSVTADTTFGSAPLAVNFTAYVDRPQDVASAEWYFDEEEAESGDGASLSGPWAVGFTANHVFEEEGAYLVRLVVRAKDGSTAEWPVQVVVANPGTIVYVDDDGGYEWQDYFLNAADAAGLKAVVVDSRFPLGLPDHFHDRMLVWDTGLSWSDTILPDQADFLGRFLDDGGRLLVLSPDYFYDYGAVTPFAGEYLHVSDFWSDAAYYLGIGNWVGVDNDPITDGMDFDTVYGLGLEDWIHLDLNARPILIDYYDEEVTPALRYASEYYRIVFSTVPWLELPDVGDDPNNAVYFLKKIHDYLMGDINVPPTITRAWSTLRVAFVGEEIGFRATAHDIDSEEEVSFEWRFSDSTTLTGASVDKAFDSPGVHNALLTVEDVDGEYTQVELSVVVVEPGDVVYVFDEDPDGDAGYQLSEALDVLEQGYVQIDSGLLVDDSTGLERFRVVWNCGEIGGLSDEECQVIARYLTNRGGLLLIGQEVMYSLESSVSNGLQFAADYLHVVDVEHDVGTAYVTGVEDSLISGAGGTYLVFPADYDDWTDSLTLDAMAKPVLMNDSDKPCALSFSGDGHRLVFMAVAFEALPTVVVVEGVARGDAPEPVPVIHRVVLLDNALKWLSKPEVTVTSPLEGELYVGTAPVLWEAVDALDEPLLIDLTYSNDGGLSWKHITVNEPNDGAYTWNLTSLPTSGAYFVRVIASKEGYAGYGDSEEFYVSVVGPNSLALGPNPASHWVNFFVNSTGGATIYVYDIAGRQVFSQALAAGESYFLWTLIDKGGRALPNGLYLCYSVTEDGVRSDIQRLVISR